MPPHQEETCRHRSRAASRQGSEPWVAVPGVAVGSPRINRYGIHQTNGRTPRPRAAALIDRLCWLHLSDFHLTAGGDQFSQTVACSALLKDVTERVAENGPVEFVLVTGDIAFSGQPAEYDEAANFMRRLAEAASVDISRFFFVPGNHDVNRHVHEFAHVGAVQILSSQQQVDTALGDLGRVVDLIDRQAAYRSFVAALTPDQERIETADSLGYVTMLYLDVLRIAIVGLNSSWLSGSDRDITTLAIGERQVTNALDLIRDFDPHLTIAMAHHPIEWLADWDQQSCRNVLLPHSHFFHRGHMHEPDVTTSPHRPCVVVAAGSSNAGRFYPNSYNLVTLNLGTAIATIHAYRYGVETRAFDHHSSIDAPCRLFQVKLPWTAEELAAALSVAAPSLGAFSHYMAAILLGQKDELPILIDTTVEFLSPDLVTETDPEQAAPAIVFLALRNLLWLYDPGIPLAERLTKCAERVNAFGAHLTGVAAADPACSARITNAVLIPSTTGSNTMPQTLALLEALRAEQQWDALELQTRRIIARRDATLERAATVALAEALMHSDEGQKRNEAATLAESLIETAGATADNYLLAAGASEAAELPVRSAEIVTKALARWPDHGALLSYGRALATRTGDAALRSALEAAREGIDS